MAASSAGMASAPAASAAAPPPPFRLFEVDRAAVYAEAEAMEARDGFPMGKCMRMCSLAELRERRRPEDTHALERLPAAAFAEDFQMPEVPEEWREEADDLEEANDTAVITMYKRSEAGALVDMDSVRPPAVLEATLSYMEDTMYDLKGYDERFGGEPQALEVYLFIWNRGRMIARDLSVQHYRKGERNDRVCQNILERLARYFVLMEHILCNDAEFVKMHRHQNTQQLNRLLVALMDLYDDARERQDASLMSPNEAEFYSYNLLLQLQNVGSVEAALQKVPPDILTHPHVAFALDVICARRTRSSAAFFRLLRRATILHGCLLARYVNATRVEALQRMCKCMTRSKDAPFVLAELAERLCFDSTEDAAKFCLASGLSCDDTYVQLDRTAGRALARCDLGSFEYPMLETTLMQRVACLSRKDIVRGGAAAGEALSPEELQQRQRALQEAESLRREHELRRRLQLREREMARKKEQEREQAVERERLEREQALAHEREVARAKAQEEERRRDEAHRRAAEEERLREEAQRKAEEAKREQERLEQLRREEEEARKREEARRQEEERLARLKRLEEEERERQRQKVLAEEREQLRKQRAAEEAARRAEEERLRLEALAHEAERQARERQRLRQKQHLLRAERALRRGIMREAMRVLCRFIEERQCLRDLRTVLSSPLKHVAPARRRVPLPKRLRPPALPHHLPPPPRHAAGSHTGEAVDDGEGEGDSDGDEYDSSVGLAAMPQHKRYRVSVADAPPPFAYGTAQTAARRTTSKRRGGHGQTERRPKESVEPDQEREEEDQREAEEQRMPRTMSAADRRRERDRQRLLAVQRDLDRLIIQEDNRLALTSVFMSSPMPMSAAAPPPTPLMPGAASFHELPPPNFPVPRSSSPDRVL